MVTRQYTEHITTDVIQVPTGSTTTLYQKVIPKKHRRWLTGAKVFAPDGDVQITLSDGDQDINPESKNVASFPKKYKYPRNLGWGSTIVVTCNHGLQRTIGVKLELEFIRDVDEGGAKQ